TNTRGPQGELACPSFAERVADRCSRRQHSVGLSAGSRVPVFSGSAFLSFQEAIHIKPMNKGVKPLVAGPVGVAQAKAVTAVLVQVELHRNLRFVPGFNYPNTAREQKVVRGYGGKHGWCVFGNIDRTHAS